MTLFQPIDKFFENSGNSAAQFTENLRDEVATFACELWQSYPGWLTKIPTPSVAFTRGFMNSMCSPIQAPVPAPDAPEFSGGQCAGVEYDVSIFYYNYNPSGCSRYEETTVRRVTGAILGIEPRVTNPNAGVTQCDPSNPNLPIQIVAWEIISSTAGAFNTGINTVYNAEAPQFTSNATIVGVTRVDGQPDDCGSLPESYPPNVPQPQDLVKNTTINVNDGMDLEVEIQFITNNEQYNFPFHFRVNGVNVAIDLGGLHWYGSPNIQSPDGEYDVPPPGSRETNDGLNNTINKTYNNEYPVVPDNPNDGTIEKEFEKFICNEGVLEIIDVVIELVAVQYPIAKLILDILNSILKDLCELETESEALVALPEWYATKPNTDRPCICYIWKEWDGNNWSKSTFASTLTYPTVDAITELGYIETFSRNMGVWLATIALDDGARLRTSGTSEADARLNLQFLMDRCIVDHLPPDTMTETVITRRDKLMTRQVWLRQVEFYPEGQSGNKNPIIRRVIDPPE